MGIFSDARLESSLAFLVVGDFVKRTSSFGKEKFLAK